MNKFVGKFLTVLAVINLIIVPCFAGERMPAGTVLVEESYVFTIDETQLMRKNILSFEKQIEEYQKLNKVKDKRFAEYENVILINNQKESEYKELREIDAKRVEQLERQIKWSKLEKWGLFTLGVGAAFAGVWIGDKIGDTTENN